MAIPSLSSSLLGARFATRTKFPPPRLVWLFTKQLTTQLSPSCAPLSTPSNLIYTPVKVQQWLLPEHRPSPRPWVPAEPPEVWWARIPPWQAAKSDNSRSRPRCPRARKRLPTSETLRPRSLKPTRRSRLAEPPARPSSRALRLRSPKPTRRLRSPNSPTPFPQEDLPDY